jgi:predicted GNAT family N-acyltransferase
VKGLSIQRVLHGSADYELSVQLRREVLRWPLGLEFSQQELEAESHEIILCGFLQDDLVATLNLVVVRSPNGLKMRQVAVRPDLQGKGVGRTLVEFAESVGIAAEASFIQLHARDTAVAFYLACGYSIEGEEFEEVGIPHRLMVKNLK